MRILLVADLHYALRQLDWLTDAAREVDVVVLAGDHLDISSSVALEAQIVVVQRYLELLAAEATTVASSGNHDLTARDAHGEKAAPWLASARAHGVLVDGDSAVVGEALFTVCPWWDGSRQRERLEAQLARDAERAVRPWIWVYHWPPDGSPTTWTGRRHYGDAELRAWIEVYAPDLVLTGHVHEPPFRADGAWADRVGPTWVFNAGRQIGPEPSHIVIDLAEGTAVWRSMLGCEVQSLEVAPNQPRPAFT